MKFEVSTMLPVYSTAVKRRLLKLLSSAWLLVYAIGFQLNDVIASTVSRNMTSYVKLRTYVSTGSKIIKQEVKLSSVVCPYEGFKSMGVKAIKTQEMCKL